MLCVRGIGRSSFSEINSFVEPVVIFPEFSSGNAILRANLLS
jgi:hypothetical protein